MGDFSSGKWVLLIFFYFSIFIFIVDAANNVQATLEFEEQGSQFSQWENTAYCSNPRTRYDYQTKEVEDYSAAQIGSLDCSESYGILSQNKCLQIEGCKWDNLTTDYWIFWTKVSNATCTGFINSTYYGVEPITVTSKAYEYIESHKAYNAFENETGNSVSPCNHKNVVFNESSCLAFSCSWIPIDYSEKFDNPKSFMKTMKDVFTFQYDFGMSNPLMAAIMNFIFIVLPLIALIIAIYFSLPLIH